MAHVELAFFVCATALCFAGGQSGESEPPSSAGKVEQVTKSADTRPCTRDDYKLMQTACDELEHRWFVGVPKAASNCKGGYVPPPLPGRPCNYSCKMGQHMDEATQGCADCPPGTYSLGDGVRWEDFRAGQLPAGFVVQPRNAWEEVNNIKGILSVEQHNLLSSAKELEHIFTTDGSRERKSATPITLATHAGRRRRQESGDGNDDDDGGFSDDCTGRGWTAVLGHLRMADPECSSSVSLDVDLVKDGELKLQYSYPKSAPFWLMLEVKSYTCTGTSGPTHFYKSLNRTTMDSFEWQTVALKAGHNVISLIAISTFTQVVSDMSVRVKRIEATGLAYATACTPCPLGTYTDEAGSAWCSKCTQLMYSDKEGASKCKSCDKNIQYPDDDHTTCLPRKPCAENDYWKIYSACDAHGKTNLTFEWTMPKLCRDDMSSAVGLPAPQRDVDCPPCNPGMSIQSNHSEGYCSQCPRGTISNGNTSCTACKPGFQAVNGIRLRWWNKHSIQDSDIDTVCTLANGDACPGKRNGWEFESNHMSVLHSTLKDGGLAHFHVYVMGFAAAAGDGSGNVGSVQFMYEVNCPPSICQFSFSDAVGHGSGDVWTWAGDRRPGKFTYHVKTRNFHDFSWTLSVPEGADWRGHDFELLKIYSIDINNTAYGGGMACKDCSSLGRISVQDGGDEDANDDGVGAPSCRGCPSGNYLDTSPASDGGRSCKPCPAGTVLSGNRRTGKDACVRCGPGTTSLEESQTCFSECKFTDGDSVLYDFTPLKGSHHVHTPSRFTPKGTRFVYEYVVSVCGEKMDANCYGNVTERGSSSRGHSFMTDYQRVDSKVCRHTVAYLSKGMSVLHGYPINLGVNLLSVERIKPIMSPAEAQALASRTMNTSQQSVALANTTGDSLISMFFHSAKGESRCEHGRMSIVNLHCDASKEGSGELHLAVTEECPGGTCDGCTFNFLWHTAHACQVCLESDFEKIEGRCFENQTKRLEYKWKGPNGQKHCYGGESLPESSWEKCSIIDTTVRAAIKKYLPFVLAIPGIVLLVVLALIIVICKNRRLTHQYQKLVQSAGDGGELPAPPTCVDDDEEDEEVMFVRGQSQTKKLVRKIQNLTKSGTKRTQDELEGDMMMDSMPLTETVDI